MNPKQKIPCRWPPTVSYSAVHVLDFGGFHNKMQFKKKNGLFHNSLPLSVSRVIEIDIKIEACASPPGFKHSLVHLLIHKFENSLTHSLTHLIFFPCILSWSTLTWFIYGPEPFRWLGLWFMDHNIVYPFCIGSILALTSVYTVRVPRLPKCRTQNIPTN